MLKFRTANEFLPHLHWLATNRTIECLCKYCSGVKNQLEVNLALGLSYDSRNNSSVSKTNNDGNQSVDSSKRRKRSLSPTRNNVSTSYEFQGPYLNEELNRDLLEDRSNFRNHELVWCSVEDLPIGTTEQLSFQIAPELGIKFWPGMCHEIILCSESRAFISIEDDVKDSGEDGSESRKFLKHNPDRHKDSPLAYITSGFENQQRYKWKVRLLGLSDIVIREEAQILPWLFKTVDLKQKFGMKKRPGMKIPQYVQNRHKSMRPTLRSLTDAEEILVTFQLALQIAANLEEFWVAHDRYDTDPDPDPNGKLPFKSQVDPFKSAPYQPKLWFQGIWWGAEKIWLHDVVRLNDLKGDLVFKSKGRFTSDSPEKSSSPINPKDICYFLKIEGIYRDELGKKLIVMGKIFDLVRSEKKSNPTSSSSTKTNEKQRQKKSKKWMPEPPAGYRFRQITKPKEMNHLHVECISGRFYSPSRKNQCDKFLEIGRRLAPKVARDYSAVDPVFSHTNNFKSPLSQEQDRGSTSLNLARQNASLFGLTPGQENFMRCRKWQPSRAESILQAESSAELAMIAAYQKLNVIHPTDNAVITPDHHKKADRNAHSKRKSGHSCTIQQDKTDILIIEIDP